MQQLGTLDLVVIGVYLAALAAVGFYFSRRQTTLAGFLVAGQRMTWLPVGMSLMAALNSGIDYLTQPSATIRYGLVLVLGTLSWLALYPWMSRVVFPFYHRLNFYSVYEYLEARFDLRVRMLGVAIFVVWRLGWMATALYVPSLAISASSGGQIDLTTLIIVLGSLVTLYTLLGGIQAVIWNDVMQFCVMFGGLAATVVIVAANVPGGLSEIWNAAAAAGKTDLWVPLNGAAGLLVQPVTVPALLSALVVGRMAQYTSDQVLVQRLQTTRTVQDARQAFVVNAAGDAVWMIGLSFVGLALFAYFQHQPAPEGLESDRMLPYFMSRAFPAGAVGLVLAAILAASLSSIDSAIHSCSSVIVIDVYNRVARGRDVAHEGLSADEERRQVRVSRLATIGVGIAGTTLACNVAGIGSLLEIANKLINSFTGPIFGIFLLAMFSERCRSAGALAGGIAGAATSYYVAYHSGFSFLWPSTFGLLATLLVGAAMTMLTRRDRALEAEALTWKAVMRRSPRAAAAS
jgi:SSS family solute:Na+ symporter